MIDCVPENPYLLLTPGPLSTSKGVRYAMLRDWCTWDADYNEQIVQNIRNRLVKLATSREEEYTAVLMQGSGTFAVEACLGTTIPHNGKVLIVTNGAYGERMVEIARVIGKPFTQLKFSETEAPDLQAVEAALETDLAITHVAMVHCETTTGMLNPLDAIAKMVKEHDKLLIVDAMSSFGGIPLDVDNLGIDYLISSANKCVQGVPGFGFVIAKKSELVKCQGNAQSLSLDLYDQWMAMSDAGKWRFTSPTHVVRAFYQALNELEEEGGIERRHERYCLNHQILVDGMRKLGYKPLLPETLQSPFITSFLYPNPDFDFNVFYQVVKSKGFVLYPGKISKADTFRIGNIGEVYPRDMERLIETIEKCTNIT